MNDILDAKFVSVWEEGKITTNCKVNIDDGHIFDIEESGDGDEFEYLINEYVIIDGLVCNIEQLDNNEYYVSYFMN